ncbi:hypothetical protein LPJ61_001182 [Coemansia biformis]|uniref:Major facilitator superfamily (MFS) profile domain-containing protein n=1 Tax=Coemansia biformis TaxID=1286918 RepID=A0A9W7YFD2_9FUNG|nr:hypothetical protein LPJ61_001182 [Coemansia biformis]
MLDRNPALYTVRHSPATIWILSSFSLFFDTFVYSLTVASLPTILQDSMGAPESANGVVTTMFGIGGVVGGAIAGILSDYMGNRRAMQTAGSLVYTAAGIVFFFSQHYYQVLLFRLINGVASGMACTLLYAALGDVYPANLLGFKVAIVAVCNNIAYTIGPLCGQRLFDAGGVRGPASAVIALSLLKLVLYATMAVDPLVIRKSVCSHVPDALLLASSGDIVLAPHGWEALAECPSDPSMAATRASLTQCPDGDNKRQLGEVPWQEYAEVTRADSRFPVLRLLTRLPVVVSTMAIISIIGVQCTLEGVIPLHLSDRFNYADSGGTTFVIFGLVFTAASPVVGWAIDVLVGRWGESMRYYTILAGSLATIPAMVLMALAGSYAVMMVGYALFAVADLCVFIPAQSAYGDLVNSIGANAMARGYSVSTFAWAVGAICLPPIGSALYERSGFAVPVIAVPAVACTISAAACVVFIISHRRSKRGGVAPSGAPDEACSSA